MNNYTISIFGNKIFFEIISELKYFSTFKVKYYNDIEKCVNEPNEKSQIIVYFLNDTNKFIFNKNTIIKHPVLLVNKFLSKKNIFNEGIEQINMPFTIIDFEQKITSIIAKNNYKKNSFISLGSYVINKYERKIKKDNLELQLSEKEINFLILFSKTTRPLSRNFVLKNVWNYSSQTETHTVETHIYRLRKKIHKKFNDDNFIKNNNEGYYI
tara:strand:- start:9 stop:644 length:636 start_codon:yes stop_codon:yes gene_type:complete